jgi:hypothetical protein
MRRSDVPTPALLIDIDIPDRSIARTGRVSHSFEYSAALFDAADDHWLVQDIDPMKLEHGLICSLN